MKRTLGLGMLAAAAAAIVSSPAAADMVPFGELLSQGWSIVGTDVIAAPDIQRAMGSKEWKDDILLTMQGPNSDVAFCHFTLGSTANSEGMLEVACFKPVAQAAAASNATPLPRSTPLIVPKS